MWYFSWVLGIAAAVLFTVVVAMKLEFQEEQARADDTDQA